MCMHLAILNTHTIPFDFALLPPQKLRIYDLEKHNQLQTYSTFGHRTYSLYYFQRITCLFGHYMAKHVYCLQKENKEYM